MVKQTRKRVGLALGNGYARGLAHIGVLEVFEREGIPVDMIAGTSIGALVGALYAGQMDAGTIKKRAVQLDWMSMTSMVDLTLPRSGFISGRKITNFLHQIIGDARFRDLKIPLACVATDIITGEEVVLNEGSVLEAIRASISIPVIFSVAKKQGRYLVDGGLVNPVPVSVLKTMGADFIIAVDLTPDRDERVRHITRNNEVDREPGMFQVIRQSIYINSYHISRTVCKGANTIIRPHVANIGPGEFTRARECILEGELAATDSIPGIKRQLASAGISLDTAVRN